MRTLVLIHGRSQQGKDSAALKQEWLHALRAGLRAAGLDEELDETKVRFPFYGDTLYALVGDAAGAPPEVVIQSGGAPGGAEEEFVAAMVADAVRTLGVSEEQIQAEELAGTVVEQGVLNWPWVLAALRAVEKIPGMGSASLALATRDVYAYLRNPGIQTKIETGVRAAFDGARECVVVGHSLGSVVAYDILVRRAAAEGWSVPSLITVGSPLAVGPVVATLAPVQRPAGVGEWLNAYDPADVVALHPLDREHFPVTPGVENYPGVHNTTSNRHGIGGYLSDPVVARRIHDALRR